MDTVFMKNRYLALGIMSGTSLDGLDLCLCEFLKHDSLWNYRILKAETLEYTPFWKDRLKSVEKASAFDLAKTNADYGHFIAQSVNRFLGNVSERPDFIASHGHTVFHQPDIGLTLQIGDGATIAAVTTIPTVSNFRSGNVAIGGQGAPLVPAGDALLFGNYDMCLNIGGFSNISYQKEQERIAFDICPANIVLNHYAEKIGLNYDKDGAEARKGKLNLELFERLNRLGFYRIDKNKSLGKEWVLEHIYPLTDAFETNIYNVLNTLTEHIAYQIAGKLNLKSKATVLITGGGANNKYLIERIGNFTANSLTLGEEDLIHYKEALIFAFLGLLRWLGEPNCLKSATGACKDHCGGGIYSTIPHAR